MASYTASVTGMAEKRAKAPDPTTLPLWSEVLPEVPNGAAALLRLHGMSAVAFQRELRSLDAAGLAALFIGAREVSHFAESVVIRAVNRETTDRFLSQGSSAVADAARAHTRASAGRQRIINDLTAHTSVAMRAATWFKEQRHLEAQIEDTQREMDAERARLADLTAERRRWLDEANEAVAAYQHRRAAAGAPRYVTHLRTGAPLARGTFGDPGSAVSAEAR